MTEPKALLAELNPPQREAVQAGDGPVLVLAGPGSGKTRVLTHRIAFLMDEEGIEPWQIMAVTFTNKAAREMKARLVELIGDTGLRGLSIGTFHAFCARLLRIEADYCPFDRRFVIFDDADQRRAVKIALEDLKADEKQFRPRAVLAAISRAKNQLVGPKQYWAHDYWHEVAGRAYVRYQEVLRASNGLDFDDLLMESVSLLRANEDVRRRYQERYRHVLVDEFQDTNTAQYELLRLLVAADEPDAPRNLFVVGDEDQSIYRWRGADYRNVDRFQRDLPGVRTILLEQNYRSSQVILDAARAIIDRNDNRTPKALWTQAERGAPIDRFEAYDESQEAAFVVKTIQAGVAAGRRYGDYAVMYRTNAQSRAIEDALVRRSLPYQLVGGTRFYERREIKDVVSYLRLIHNPADELALERVINVPPRGIGPKAIAGLESWCAALSLATWPALALVSESDGVTPDAPELDRRTVNSLSGFYRVMAELVAARDELPVSKLLAMVLAKTGYEDWLRDGSDEGEERWDNVRELSTVTTDFDALEPPEGLGMLLESVALLSDVDSMEAAPDRVTLLTLHSAKGLEFPVVLITGVEEGILPHSRSRDDPEELAEERRLFYVGITRAQERLHLVHTFRRRVFGSEDVRTPSRFLADLPSSLVVTEGKPITQVTPKRRSLEWETAEKETEAPEQQFKSGDRVRHPSFGDGVVVDSRLSAGDEEVTVAFPDVGVKRLMQSIARLQKQ